MKHGRVGHTKYDPFLIFADYVYESMKLKPIHQMRSVFTSITKDTEHNIEDVRKHVYNKLKRDGLL